ncbi:MAG: sulfite exporter TauE/SafE family protein [Gammaproteobacteria bacterium]|nr:sulfite exporter TauE/SafE family protein [Gammaproteobacteria bacterium]
MQLALAGTALLMGLAGGPHCVAMCGAACASLSSVGRAVPVRGPRPAAALRWTAAEPGTLAFHAGRVASYALGGAIAATAVQQLGAAGQHVAALRPLWTLLHVFVFAWGVMLAVLGRQPLWASGLGRSVVNRLRTGRGTSAGILAAGSLWVLMPCGLLYSALMLASLANDGLQGAVVMALFAAGSAVSLVLAPWLLLRLGAGIGTFRRDWGTRFAGAALALVSVQAIWTDLAHQVALWCS